MMKALPIIFISLIALSACTKNQGNGLTTKTYNPGQDTLSNTGQVSYLALGDSYTIGQSVPANESYPLQLTNSLEEQSFLMQPPNIIATTGWTTYNLINALAFDKPGNKYSFVTLLIGVNDQFTNVSQSTYRTNFVQLLHSAITFAQGDSTRVFVLSIPDYGVTPFAQGAESTIGPQIDQFNAINKQETLNAGANYLNITGISREAATDTSLIASDGLHPSGKMYTLWVQLLAPMVAARLNKK